MPPQLFTVRGKYSKIPVVRHPTIQHLMTVHPKAKVLLLPATSSITEMGISQEHQSNHVSCLKISPFQV
jgi:hypothetical protein